MDPKVVGAFGESLALNYYKKNGYRIRVTNFHTRLGEIDIIAQKGNMLVFSEVKTRREDAIDTPRASVTPAKQRKLILAAQGYVMLLDSEDFVMRFDVVEVLIPARGKPSVHCIENAFTL